MERLIKEAFVKGYERISAWSDLFDDMNVFPVKDRDTGQNLKLTLLPLKYLNGNREKAAHDLIMNAVGNSGNIAGAFFSEFILAQRFSELISYGEKGKNRAFDAVTEPKEGTMLTLIDELIAHLNTCTEHQGVSSFLSIIPHLENVVHETTEKLTVLKEAGVVDAGALAMYLFFEAFFSHIAGTIIPFKSVTHTFKCHLLEKKRDLPSTLDKETSKVCIDASIRLNNTEVKDDVQKRLNQLGDSVVAISEKNLMKIHIHSEESDILKNEISALGKIETWEKSTLAPLKGLSRNQINPVPIHLVTDAAGSLSRSFANELGITLLDSYVIMDDNVRPETHTDPLKLFLYMKDGGRASTAQASNYERYQCYQSILARYDQVIYLCVGASYTGNYSIAMNWKKDHDLDEKLSIIDTGMASGKLAILSIAASFLIGKSSQKKSVLEKINGIMKNCHELIFIDQLKYLVQSGRISKTKGFFSDALGLKPVVSPMPGGVEKMGVVRNEKGQIAFAMNRIEESVKEDGRALFLLEYTDNEDWVREVVGPLIQKAFPFSDIFFQPMSLTASVHMGPRTWAIAYLPGGSIKELKEWLR